MKPIARRAVWHATLPGCHIALIRIGTVCSGRARPHGGVTGRQPGESRGWGLPEDDTENIRPLTV